MNGAWSLVNPPLFDESKKCIFEGWMWKSKVRMVVGDSWQKRYFRLQDRILFYFKDPTQRQNGYIPLMGVSLTDLPEKRRKYSFEIKLDARVVQGKLVKRDTYPIAAESAESREEWKRLIDRYSAEIIVGDSYDKACNSTPSERHCHRLIPYFVLPLLETIELAIGKRGGMWTSPVPAEATDPFLFTINQNMPVSTRDPVLAAGILCAWLLALPQSPMLAEQAKPQDPSVDQLLAALVNSPAPAREFFRVMARHFSLLVQGGVATRQQLSFLGSYLFKGRFSEAYRRDVVEVLIDQGDRLWRDVHSFASAFSEQAQQQTQRARLSKPLLGFGENVVEGPKGTLIYVVRAPDAAGWSVCHTANRRIGLVHKSAWAKLTRDEEADLDAGKGVDVLMGMVRDNCPMYHLLFDGMAAELNALTQVLAIAEGKL